MYKVLYSRNTWSHPLKIYNRKSLALIEIKQEKKWTSTNDSGIQQLEGGQRIVNMWRISDKGASGSKFILE